LKQTEKKPDVVQSRRRGTGLVFPSRRRLGGRRISLYRLPKRPKKKPKKNAKKKGIWGRKGDQRDPSLLKERTNQGEGKKERKIGKKSKEHGEGGQPYASDREGPT